MFCQRLYYTSLSNSAPKAIRIIANEKYTFNKHSKPMRKVISLPANIINNNATGAV